MRMTINGVEYVSIDEVEQMTMDKQVENCEGMPYCMVRTYSAGVFCGYVEKREGKEVTLRNARRIWEWDGAASLSQLAMEGTSNPEGCKFPCEVGEVVLTEAIEIIPMTEKAKKSIEEVPVWKA